MGRWLSAHAGALGKALLAEHPDVELPDVPYEALTPRTHTTRAALVADLAQVRDCGYSIDREEGVTGIVGFGFALRVNGEAPAGDAISCSVPVARLTEERERRIVSVMQKVREEIEARLAQGAGRRAQGAGRRRGRGRLALSSPCPDQSGNWRAQPHVLSPDPPST